MNGSTHLRGSAWTLLAVHLAALAHASLVRHVMCADGQLVDVRGQLVERRAPVAREPRLLSRESSELESTHEHCGVPNHLKRPASRTPPQTLDAPFVIATLGKPIALSTRGSRPPLETAPKQSPPS